MFDNPVIGILHNTSSDRWHPVLFTESPLPGPEELGKPIRHKSRMHHTKGFATRDEAITSAREELAVKVPGAKFALDADLSWDGDGIPALTIFFDELTA